MNIGELNVRGEVREYASTKDDSGRNTSSLTDSWTKWAKIEQDNGSQVLDNAAITYKQNYTVTMRRESSRPTLEKHKFFYGLEMQIHSVIVKQIGKHWYEILTCFTQK